MTVATTPDPTPDDDSNSGAHLRPPAAWTAAAEALATLRRARAEVYNIPDGNERTARLVDIGNNFANLAVLLATNHISPPSDDEPSSRHR